MRRCTANSQRSLTKLRQDECSLLDIASDILSSAHSHSSYGSQNTDTAEEDDLKPPSWTPSSVTQVLETHQNWLPSWQNGRYGGDILLVVLGKLHYLRAGGGAAADANPYNSRESPYLRKRFFTCPLILPKDSENIVGLKFFAPP